MGQPRSFRFGVEMMAPFEGLTWAESARELEALGYSTLFVPDHFDEGYGPITAMATAAAATSTLRVASAVFAPDFRHPAVLARELASIDQLSQGRLEVGIGAGYQVADYRTSGIPMDPPGVRVDRMIEYVAVLRGLFADGPFSFAGKHFQIAALDGSPAPFRPGGPPIFVAGGGKRMLSFAAAHADIVGVNPTLPTSEARAAAARDALPGSIDEKLSWIRAAAGPRFDDLELHGWLRHAHVTNDAMALAEGLAAGFQADAAEVLDSPIVLIGDIGEIGERLHARRERWGYSYFTIQQSVAREFAPVVALLSS
ncbi:MAG TPA: TIGR03621 family F420-dependent LLM class oxidoreductase [Mycobacteriales bacterium]|nr:TIGR03621 family F420-dependent LLM class oxidoreductase [Mycobacteriales bacterium]